MTGAAMRWYLAVALRSVGQRVRSVGATFSAHKLVAWTPEFASQADEAGRWAQAALKMMRRCGYAEAVGPVSWRMTPAGWALARAVAQAWPGARVARANALPARLWTLLRIRRQMSSEEAASVLLDAGARHYKEAQRRIAAYLRGWSQTVPHAVALARPGVAGRKRYVLLRDLGRCPPPWRGPVLPAVPRMAPVPVRYLPAAVPADGRAQ